MKIGYIELPKQRRFASRARQRLLRVKERCSQLDHTSEQRESDLRSLILPREEEDDKDILKMYEYNPDFLSLISYSVSSHESNFEPWVGNIQVGMIKCEVDPSLPRVDEIFGCVHSGPATKSLSLLRNRNISYSLVDLSPLSYDRATMYLLIGDLVFLDITLGYEDQNVRDFVGCMAKQNIYLSTLNEGTLICGNKDKVTTAAWRSWKGIQHTFLVQVRLIHEFLTALVVGSNCGFIWSEVLN